LNKNEELLNERDLWKEKAEAPNRRVYKIPPELGNFNIFVYDIALSSMNGYSSLVDQLIESLMASKLKDRELARNRALLEHTKVFFNLIEI
jgi:hypothetical protein